MKRSENQGREGNEHPIKHSQGLPWWLDSKSVCPQCWRPRSHPWVRKIPWRRKWQPTPVPLPGKFCGLEPDGFQWAAESDKTEQLHFRFQRIAQRDKKAFFNEQCLIIEGNNKRGKTRKLFGKIRSIKGAFCPKMGTTKDKNGRVRGDAEEIKQRWKEYLVELY